MVKTSIKDILIVLEKVLYIYYPVWFKSDEIKALINSGNKVNNMILQYAAKLSLKIRRTNISAQKINGSTLKTFKMVLVSFQLEDQFKKLASSRKPFY